MNREVALANARSRQLAYFKDNIVSQDEPDDFDASRYYYNRDDGGLSREGDAVHPGGAPPGSLPGLGGAGLGGGGGLPPGGGYRDSAFGGSIGGAYPAHSGGAFGGQPRNSSGSGGSSSGAPVSSQHMGQPSGTYAPSSDLLAMLTKGVSLGSSGSGNSGGGSNNAGAEAGYALSPASTHATTANSTSLGGSSTAHEAFGSVSANAADARHAISQGGAGATAGAAGGGGVPSGSGSGSGGSGSGGSNGTMHASRAVTTSVAMATDGPARDTRAFDMSEFPALSGDMVPLSAYDKRRHDDDAKHARPRTRR